MSDVTYVVSTKYTVDSAEAHAKVGKLASAFDGLGKAANMAAGMFDSVVRGIAAVGAAAGIAAAVAGVHALKTGLVDVNASLEDSAIGMATAFTMLTDTPFEQSLQAAKGLIADIRKDAAALPGSFQDFVGMSQTLSAPLLNAGKSLKDVRDLTRQTALASAALLNKDGVIDFAQGARDMAMLIEGRAGTHNVLGMRAGITAHTQVNGKNFNEASTDERMKFLSEKFGKTDAALESWKHSWTGLTSTMKDDLHQLYGRATAPLFAGLKKQFEKVNAMLESSAFEKIADKVGEELMRGFDYAVRASVWIADHWDTISTGVRRFASALVEAFDKVKPIAQHLASIVAANPVGIGKEMLAARVGIAAAPMISGAAGAVGTAGGAALGIAALGVIGAFDLLTSDVKKMPPALQEWAAKARSMWETVKSNFEQIWDNLKAIWGDLETELRPVVDFIGLTLLQTLTDLSTAAVWLTDKFKEFTAWLKTLPGVGKYFQTNDEDSGKGPAFSELSPERQKAWIKEHVTLGDEKAIPISKEKAQLDAAAELKKMTDQLKNAGKTNIVVNAPLTVLSDADPERLAKKVATHIETELVNLKPSLIGSGLRGAF